MKKLCLVCDHEMQDNCHLEYTSSQLLGELNLIIDGEDYRKSAHQLRCRYCPNCGHVEFYIDLDKPQVHEEKKVSNSYKELVETPTKKGR